MTIPSVTDAGFFGPESLTWRIDRELAVLFASGGRALLLQVAHPLVAAAVVEHSCFATDPLGRLRHTLEAIYAFAFADSAGATRVIQRINRRHAVVSGTLSVPVGAHPADTSYRALDPNLMLWVYATLIDSSLVAYERFVGPLSDSEREAYYQEMRRAGSAWGVPAAAFPRSLTGLRQWMDQLIRSGQVSVGPQGRLIARQLFASPAWWLPAPLMTPSKLVTAWLLPIELRRGFGFDWGPRRDHLMRLLAATSRAVVPRLPRVLRDVPYARAALRRLR
jgi:uncharacterized protein (DUF2236 family)